MNADINLKGSIIRMYNIIGQVIYSQKIDVDANSYFMNVVLLNKFTSSLFVNQVELKGEVKT